MAITSPSYNRIIRDVTENYLDELDMTTIGDIFEIEDQLLTAVKERINDYNNTVIKAERFLLPKHLSPMQIAQVINAIYPVCSIGNNGAQVSSEYDVLAIYQDSGYNKGIYVTDENLFRKYVTKLNYNISSKDFTEVMISLKSIAQRRFRNTNPDLIAVNNGVFNFETKELQEFTPEHIFMAKSHVDYVENPTNPVIHNEKDGTDWDIVSWLDDLNDDPEIVNLIWEILGAIIRPNVKWDKSAWFYSDVGSNGKGTLCHLMRQLCGAGSWASIPLTDFSKDFALEQLATATAIIVDENDVGSFVDQAANLKSVITNDVITINRKHKSMIAHQFFGFMVQCLNEFPKIRDRSESFYRRQLFIPMNKSFTGIERKYIKSDYMNRPEVLEYVLHRVLNMNYYQLSNPASCQAVLDAYKEYNDPMRQFYNEVTPELQWDFVPFTYVFDLYKVWFERNVPNGKPIGRNKFVQEFIALLNKDDRWLCTNKDQLVRAGKLMDKPEPLTLEYNLTKWMHPTYKGSDSKKMATPLIATPQRGFWKTDALDAQNNNGGTTNADTDVENENKQNDNSIGVPLS